MLQMRGITKRFPGVLANDHVDFDVRAGEVHTLFGENGAGKSTLMRVLYGLYRPGRRRDPDERRAGRHRVARRRHRHGIGMIHQHFMLVPTLTVAENVALGLKSTRGPLTDLRRVSDRIRELSETYGLEVDPQALIWQLSVGERQRVEIIKALYRDVSLLVLDEPTAVLTPREVDDLFGVLRQMAADGRGLIFISHKIREVLAPLRPHNGASRRPKIATVGVRSDREKLAEMMVGPRSVARGGALEGPAAEVRLGGQRPRVTGDRGTEAVRGRVPSGPRW